MISERRNALRQARSCYCFLLLFFAPLLTKFATLPRSVRGETVPAQEL